MPGQELIARERPAVVEHHHLFAERTKVESQGHLRPDRVRFGKNVRRQEEPVGFFDNAAEVLPAVLAPHDAPTQ
jgi:hypothetical protein